MSEQPVEEEQLWVAGSRACRRCGALVVDGLRSIHMRWHAEQNRPDPEPNPDKPARTTP